VSTLILVGLVQGLVQQKLYKSKEPQGLLIVPEYLLAHFWIGVDKISLLFYACASRQSENFLQVLVSNLYTLKDSHGSMTNVGVFLV